VSSASYVVSLMPPRIVSELGLRRFGYRVSILEPDYWVLYPDGSSLTLWEDAGRTAEEIARFSKHDADQGRPVPRPAGAAPAAGCCSWCRRVSSWGTPPGGWPWRPGSAGGAAPLRRVSSLGPKAQIPEVWGQGIGGDEAVGSDVAELALSTSFQTFQCPFPAGPSALLPGPAP
jgi:hypothetical protein